MTPVQQSAGSMVEKAIIEILGKARQPPSPQPTRLRDMSVTIMFSGGGNLVASSGLAGVVKVPTSGTINRVFLIAGNDNLEPVAVTASVDLRFGGPASLPGSPLWVTSPPTLSGESYAEADLTGWIRNVVSTDLILYRLVSLSGSATWLALCMDIRGTLAEEGSAGIVDDTGDTVVDDDGNVVVLRT